MNKKESDASFGKETLYQRNRMIAQARIVDMEDVVEINTCEQLRNFDSNSKQLNRDVLTIICKQFDCEYDDIVDIEVLKKGMTNRSFLFKIRGGEFQGKYIMRIPGEGTDQLIDRTAEALVYKQIRNLSFCDNPVYINPENGYKITKYIENVRCCDPEKEEDIRACMKKLRFFHEMTVEGTPLTVPHPFELFERIDFYEKLWNGSPSVYRDYENTKKNCKRLATYIERHKEPFRLTHIDAVPDNFLFDPSVDGELAVQLTDWEYAGMQDNHVDIAMFAIYALYDKIHVDRLIDIYFEKDGGCNKETRAKIYCYVAVCGLIWSNWCEYKRNLGVEFGEYSLRQYQYGKDFYKYALDLINEIGEPL